MARPDEHDPFSEDWQFEETDSQMLRELANLMGSPKVSREAPEQIAEALATAGQTEANVDPEHRLLFDDLSALAQRIVTTSTGFTTVAETQTVNRGAWARQTVRDWRHYTDALGNALRDSSDSDPDLAESDFSLSFNPEALLGRLMASLTPVMAAIWVGTTVGRLARSSLGPFDVPVPRGDSGKILLVAPNIARAAKAWSLSLEDAGLWVCLNSSIVSCLLEMPHVALRLNELICGYMESCLRMRLESAADSVGRGFLQDPADIQKIFTKPESLLSIEDEPGSRARSDLADLVAILVAYTDVVTEQMGRQLLGPRSPVPEAFSRRRLIPPSEYASVCHLFGVNVSKGGIQRGETFVRGVIERAGLDGLHRIWTAARRWPTPSEIEAPGLWLARLDLQEPSP